MTDVYINKIYHLHFLRSIENSLNEKLRFSRNITNFQPNEKDLFYKIKYNKFYLRVLLQMDAQQNFEYMTELNTLFSTNLHIDHCRS